MPKILHTYRYTGIPWEILKSVVPAGYTVKTLEAPTQEQLIKEVVDADYLLVSGRLKIDSSVLDNARHLRMIQRTGVGVDMLDLKEITRRGIPIYVNSGINARSVAEHTLALILGCLKRLIPVDKQVRQGIWKKQETGTSCHELYGKTVGLVGMGAIGQYVATYLKCFGANVIYFDPFRLEEDKERSLELKYVSALPALLAESDIISLHCPLTEDNENFINANTIGMMKNGAILVNTARGKLINEHDLYEALRNGKLSFAALDVHASEPIRDDNPLKSLDNVLLTPHIGGLSFETFQAMMKGAVDNIVAFDRVKLKEIEEKKLIVDEHY